MPVDPTVTRYKRVEGGTERVVLDSGEVIACTTDIPAEESDGVGYISHLQRARTQRLTEKEREDKGIKKSPFQFPGRDFT